VAGGGKFLGAMAVDLNAAKELFRRDYQLAIARPDSIELAKQFKIKVDAFRKDT
jgi:hypothetical protein